MDGETRLSYQLSVPYGPPPNITSTYLDVNNGPLAELNIAAMLGVMNAYPDKEDSGRLDVWTSQK
ncbi:secretory lipase-domain-containing protein [Penicillium lividum]|nr:secretory lipase-domain-containing protein [Penicillium lividum]